MEMCGLVRPPRGILASKIYFLREKIDSHRWSFVCRGWNLLRRHAVRAAHTAHRLRTAIVGGYGGQAICHRPRPPRGVHASISLAAMVLRPGVP